METSRRDLSIIRKMAGYCEEIGEAHEKFGRSFEAFSGISVYRNAVCLCIMQIGELANNLSDEFKDDHKSIPWRSIRRMRNIVAHEYGKIDIDVVWETLEGDIPELYSFCKCVLQGENK